MLTNDILFILTVYIIMFIYATPMFYETMDKLFFNKKYFITNSGLPSTLGVAIFGMIATLLVFTSLYVIKPKTGEAFRFEVDKNLPKCDKPGFYGVPLQRVPFEYSSDAERLACGMTPAQFAPYRSTLQPPKYNLGIIRG